MGITYNSALASNSKLAFTNRARVTFTLTGETDGGLAFGGSFRADNAGAASTGTAGSVFISGDFGRLRMGDVDDAFGALFGDISGVGLQAGSGLFAINELSHSADGGAFSLGTATGAALGLVNGVVFDANPLSSPTLNAAPVFNSLWKLNAAGTSWTLKQADLEATLEKIAGLFGLDEDDFIADFYEAGWGADVDDLFEDGVFVLPGGTDFNFNGILAAEAFQNGVIGALGFDGIEDFIEEFGIVPANFFGGFGDGESDLFGWNIASSITAAPIAARVLYDYSIDGFSFAAGYSQTGPNQAGSVAAAYTFEGLTVSAGYGQARWRDGYKASITATGLDEDAPVLADGVSPNFKTVTVVSRTEDLKAKDFNIGVRYTMDGLTAAAVYQDKRFDIGGTRIDKHRTIGASLAYTMDAITVTAFGQQVRSDLATQNAHAYGIGAAYDLGGGASLRGGVINQREFTGSSFNVADFGVAFRF